MAAVVDLLVRDPWSPSADNLKRAKYIRVDRPRRAGAAVEANQDALAQAGHWGVPTFVLDGEPFFGEDRIDTLRWRLARRGLQRG